MRIKLQQLYPIEISVRHSKATLTFGIRAGTPRFTWGKALGSIQLRALLAAQQKTMGLFSFQQPWRQVLMATCSSSCVALALEKALSKSRGSCLQDFCCLYISVLCSEILHGRNNNCSGGICWVSSMAAQGSWRFQWADLCFSG